MSGTDGILERTLRANEEQAKAAGALVEIQRGVESRLETLEDQTRQQTNALERVADTLERLNADVKEGRDIGIKAVTAHTEQAVSAAFGRSEMWWRRAYIVGVLLIALASIVGAAINRVWPLVGTR